MQRQKLVFLFLTERANDKTRVFLKWNTSFFLLSSFFFSTLHCLHVCRSIDLCAFSCLCLCSLTPFFHRPIFFLAAFPAVSLIDVKVDNSSKAIFLEEGAGSVPEGSSNVHIPLSILEYVASACEKQGLRRTEQRQYNEIIKGLKVLDQMMTRCLARIWKFS